MEFLVQSQYIRLIRVIVDPIFILFHNIKLKIHLLSQANKNLIPLRKNILKIYNGKKGIIKLQENIQPCKFRKRVSVVNFRKYL